MLLLVDAVDDWPEALSDSLKRAAIEQLQRLDGGRVSFKGATLVDSGRLELDKFFAVVAVSAKAVEGPPVSYRTIAEGMAGAFARGDSRLRASIYLEFCPTQQIPLVINLLAANLGKQYGDQLAAVVSGERLRAVGAGWKTGLAEEDETLEEPSLESLFQRLAQRPYDPRLCLALADRLRHAGLVRNAQLFYARGTSWWMSPADNQRCLEQTELPWARKMVGAPPGLPQRLIGEVLGALTGTTLQLGPTARLIVQSMGKVPVENATGRNDALEAGRAKYFCADPDLAEAVIDFLRAVEISLSAGACNMLGASLRLTDRPLLAIPFLRQALKLDAHHQHAPVHLACIYKSLGYDELAGKEAAKVKATTRLDEWGRNELRKHHLLY